MVIPSDGRHHHYRLRRTHGTLNSYQVSCPVGSVTGLRRSITRTHFMADKKCVWDGPGGNLDANSVANHVALLTQREQFSLGELGPVKASNVHGIRSRTFQGASYLLCLLETMLK